MKAVAAVRRRAMNCTRQDVTSHRPPDPVALMPTDRREKAPLSDTLFTFPAGMANNDRQTEWTTEHGDDDVSCDCSFRNRGVLGPL